MQLPPGIGPGMVGEGGWIKSNSHSQNNSPRYSPDPGEIVAAVGGGGASGGLSYPVNSMGVVSVGGREGGRERKRWNEEQHEVMSQPSYHDC